MEIIINVIQAWAVLPRIIIIWIIHVIRTLILLPRMEIIINVIRIILWPTTIIRAITVDSMVVGCIELIIWRGDPVIVNSIMVVVPLRVVECNEARITILWRHHNLLLDHIKFHPKDMFVVYVTFLDTGFKLVQRIIITMAAVGITGEVCNIAKIRRDHRHLIRNQFHQKDTYVVSVIYPVIGFKFVQRKRWINSSNNNVIILIRWIVVEGNILDLLIQFLQEVE